MPVVPALGRGSGVQASPDYKKACLKKKKKKGSEHLRGS